MTEKLEETLAAEEQQGMIREAESDGADTAMEEQQEKRSAFSIVRELLIYLVVLMLCVTVVPKYVLQRTQVDGESMEDTLQDYDNLLVEKVSYYFKNPERFDIVTLYPNGRDENVYYIKRIIGLPGENVRIEGNKIYINGTLLKENYGKDGYIEEAGRAAGEGITLGDDEFFVMGDNRNNSVDSRFEVGPVKKKNIDGHAVFRICSFQKNKDGSKGKISFSKIGVLD